MWRKGDEPVPGYQLQEFLGRGQFGEVWRSTAPGGTVAALKFISLSRTQGLKEFRGIRRVKEIRHAHLMPITALWLLDTEGNILDSQVLQSYHPEPKPIQGTLNLQPPVDEREDTDVQPEWLVVAMLLGDLNLSDRLEQCKSEGMSGIPAQELLDYMEEASKAIDFLNTPQHDLGEGPVSIQHCDIKPANIMLVGGSVVICDFGLARVLTDVTTTATGMVGSPAYMPPESIIRRPGIYLSQEKYASAISAYKRSVKYNPKGYRAHYNLAIAIQSNDPENYDEALAAWRQAYKVCKNVPKAKDLAASAKSQIAELEKAKKESTLGG